MRRVIERPMPNNEDQQLVPVTNKKVDSNNNNTAAAIEQEEWPCNPAQTFTVSLSSHGGSIPPRSLSMADMDKVTVPHLATFNKLVYYEKS
jgi:hypothetical protein